MNNAEASSCKGKTPYKSWFSANEILKKRKHRGKNKKNPLHIYKCKFCPAWHLGAPFEEEVAA